MQHHGFLDTGFKQTGLLPFSPCYLSGIKNETTFKRELEKAVPKLSVNSGNCNSLDSHKNQYPEPVLNFGFTKPQNSD